MSDYLTADELADLVQCLPNQRTLMAKWLDREGWVWVSGRHGLPRVSRAYHDMKMGLKNGKKKHDQTPNIDAFVGRNGGGSSLQAGR